MASRKQVGINISAFVDTRNSKQKLNQLANDLAKTQKVAKTTASAFTSLEKSIGHLGRANLDFQNIANQVKELGTHTKGLKAAFAASEKSITKFASTLKASSADVNKFTRAVQLMNSQMLALEEVSKKTAFRNVLKDIGESGKFTGKATAGFKHLTTSLNDVSSNLKKIKPAVKDSQESFRKVSKVVAMSSKATEDSAKAVETLSKSLEGSTDSVNQVNRSTKKLGTGFRKFASVVKSSIKLVDKNNKSLRGLRSASSSANKALKKIRTSLKDVGSFIKGSAVSFNELSEAIGRIAGLAKSFADGIVDASQRVRKVNVNLSNSFKAIRADAEEQQKIMKFLQSTMKATAFSMDELSFAFAQFTALGATSRAAGGGVIAAINLARTLGVEFTEVTDALRDLLDGSPEALAKLGFNVKKYLVSEIEGGSSLAFKEIIAEYGTFIDDVKDAGGLIQRITDRFQRTKEAFFDSFNESEVLQKALDKWDKAILEFSELDFDKIADKLSLAFAFGQEVAIHLIAAALKFKDVFTEALNDFEQRLNDRQFTWVGSQIFGEPSRSAVTFRATGGINKSLNALFKEIEKVATDRIEKEFKDLTPGTKEYVKELNRLRDETALQITGVRLNIQELKDQQKTLENLSKAYERQDAVLKSFQGVEGFRDRFLSRHGGVAAREKFYGTQSITLPTGETIGESVGKAVQQVFLDDKLFNRFASEVIGELLSNPKFAKYLIDVHGLEISAGQTSVNTAKMYNQDKDYVAHVRAQYGFDKEKADEAAEQAEKQSEQLDNNNKLTQGIERNTKDIVDNTKFLRDRLQGQLNLPKGFTASYETILNRANKQTQVLANKLINSFNANFPASETPDGKFGQLLNKEEEKIKIDKQRLEVLKSLSSETGLLLKVNRDSYKANSDNLSTANSSLEIVKSGKKLSEEQVKQLGELNLTSVDVEGNTSKSLLFSQKEINEITSGNKDNIDYLLGLQDRVREQGEATQNEIKISEKSIEKFNKEVNSGLTDGFGGVENGVEIAGKLTSGATDRVFDKNDQQYREMQAQGDKLVTGFQEVITTAAAAVQLLSPIAYFLSGKNPEVLNAAQETLTFLGTVLEKTKLGHDLGKQFFGDKGGVIGAGVGAVSGFFSYQIIREEREKALAEAVAKAEAERVKNIFSVYVSETKEDLTAEELAILQKNYENQIKYGSVHSIRITPSGNKLVGTGEFRSVPNRIPSSDGDVLDPPVYESEEITKYVQAFKAEILKPYFTKDEQDYLKVLLEQFKEGLLDRGFTREEVNKQVDSALNALKGTFKDPEIFRKDVLDPLIEKLQAEIAEAKTVLPAQKLANRQRADNRFNNLGTAEILNQIGQSLTSTDPALQKFGLKQLEVYVGSPQDKLEYQEYLLNVQGALDNNLQLIQNFEEDVARFAVEFNITEEEFRTTIGARAAKIHRELGAIGFDLKDATGYQIGGFINELNTNEAFKVLYDRLLEISTVGFTLDEAIKEVATSIGTENFLKEVAGSVPASFFTKQFSEFVDFFNEYGATAVDLVHNVGFDLDSLYEQRAELNKELRRIQNDLPGEAGPETRKLIDSLGLVELRARVLSPRTTAESLDPERLEGDLVRSQEKEKEKEKRSKREKKTRVELPPELGGIIINIDNPITKSIFEDAVARKDYDRALEIIDHILTPTLDKVARDRFDRSLPGDEERIAAVGLSYDKLVKELELHRFALKNLEQSFIPDDLIEGYLEALDAYERTPEVGYANRVKELENARKALQDIEIGEDEQQKKREERRKRSEQEQTQQQRNNLATSNLLKTTLSSLGESLDPILRGKIDSLIDLKGFEAATPEILDLLDRQLQVNKNLRDEVAKSLDTTTPEQRRLLEEFPNAQITQLEKILKANEESAYLSEQQITKFEELIEAIKASGLYKVDQILGKSDEDKKIRVSEELPINKVRGFFSDFGQVFYDEFTRLNLDIIRDIYPTDEANKLISEIISLQGTFGGSLEDEADREFSQVTKADEIIFKQLGGVEFADEAEALLKAHEIALKKGSEGLSTTFVILLEKYLDAVGRTGSARRQKFLDENKEEEKKDRIDPHSQHKPIIGAQHFFAGAGEIEADTFTEVLLDVARDSGADPNVIYQRTLDLVTEAGQSGVYDAVDFKEEFIKILDVTTPEQRELNRRYSKQNISNEVLKELIYTAERLGDLGLEIPFDDGPINLDLAQRLVAARRATGEEQYELLAEQVKEKEKIVKAEPKPIEGKQNFFSGIGPGAVLLPGRAELDFAIKRDTETTSEYYSRVAQYISNLGVLSQDQIARLELILDQTTPEERLFLEQLGDYDYDPINEALIANAENIRKGGEGILKGELLALYEKIKRIHEKTGKFIFESFIEDNEPPDPPDPYEPPFSSYSALLEELLEEADARLTYSLDRGFKPTSIKEILPAEVLKEFQKNLDYITVGDYDLDDFFEIKGAKIEVNYSPSKTPFQPDFSVEEGVEAGKTQIEEGRDELREDAELFRSIIALALERENEELRAAHELRSYFRSSDEEIQSAIRGSANLARVAELIGENVIYLRDILGEDVYNQLLEGRPTPDQESLAAEVLKIEQLSHQMFQINETLLDMPEHMHKNAKDLEEQLQKEMIDVLKEGNKIVTLGNKIGGTQILSNEEIARQEKALLEKEGNLTRREQQRLARLQAARDITSDEIQIDIGANLIKYADGSEKSLDTLNQVVLLDSKTGAVHRYTNEQLLEIIAENTAQRNDGGGLFGFLSGVGDLFSGGLFSGFTNIFKDFKIPESLQKVGKFVGKGFEVVDKVNKFAGKLNTAVGEIREGIDNFGDPRKNPYTSGIYGLIDTYNDIFNRPNEVKVINPEDISDALGDKLDEKEEEEPIVDRFRSILNERQNDDYVTFRDAFFRDEGDEREEIRLLIQIGDQRLSDILLDLQESGYQTVDVA